MDSRRPTYAGPPPPNNHHDPRAPPPVPQFAPAQQHQYQQQHHGPPPPPPPQQQHHQHHQQHYPPPQHHHAGPPPPSQPQAQPPPQHHQQQQQQQHPQPYPPPHSGASTTSIPGPVNLPPLQAGPQTGSSSESYLPPIRQTSGTPAAHDPRDAAPQYHTDPYHNRSGHATPAPVNRSYSHDSGQQRTPATPTGPPAFSHPPGPEGAQQPPPGPPPPPQPMDHGHHPYPPPTNGVQHHGLPHHPPSHHEPHPQYGAMPTPMMDQHHSYPPPGQPMYQQPQPYGPASANIYGPKRKQMRATQACEQCRQRKQKCDEGSPCSFCKENSLSCQYRDTPPAKTDKNMEKLLQYMENNTAQIAALTAKIDSVDNRLRRIETNGPISRQSNHDNQPSYTEAGAEMGAELTTETTQPPRPQTTDFDDHRTAPHKLLLLWPSVRPLLQDAGVELNDGYVMEAEDRGILRLWTRGEGIDENDGTQAGGPASPARSDESGEVGNASTPSTEGVWGIGFTHPSTPNSDARRSEPYGAGGLKANGEVDLDANTVNMLYESYMQNLHVMHPFLDRRRLRKMFDTFIKRYSTGRPRAAFAVGTEYGERPLKRQRSNGSTANIGGTGPDGEMRREPTERSPANGIIFLVLALGKICLYKDPLPGIVQDSKLQTNAMVAHGMRSIAAASPIQFGNAKHSPPSPYSQSTPAAQATPQSETNMRMPDARSRRSSVDGSSPSSTPGPRNMDVLPGLAYFAKAAEILGDQADGNDLCHAQMFLLAGLYKGQLARVKESMSWFTMAGRACRILLDRYKLYNSQYWGDHSSNLRSNFIHSQSRIKDTRQSLIVLASWSCLQLESDILAELRLPDSGIQKVENILVMPHKVADDESYAGLEPLGQPDNYDDLLIFYSAQMFLRRKLNQIHQELYGKKAVDMALSAVKDLLQDHDGILQTWREGLPPQLKWQDEEDPPSDILNARLRAKYWGARYVANRPYLDYTLHIMPHVSKAAEPHAKSIDSVAKDAYGNPRDKADVHIFKAIQMIGDREAWEGSRRCIEAAMHSTIAFDGVDDRLIVTNIHGTAHAQFGNMLVLSAVYNSVLCRPLVDEAKFKALLQRTIGFLRKLHPISPTCVADCGILERFQNTFFGEQDKSVYGNQGIEPSTSASATTSFVSNPPS